MKCLKFLWLEALRSLPRLDPSRPRPSSGFHSPINNSRGCERTAFHRELPAGPDGQEPLCLRVHLPCSTCTRDALLLCCPFLFSGIPLFFPSSSPSLPRLPPHATPTSSFSPFLSHWWFVFLSGGISGSHSARTHYSPLIHSRGWAPAGRMGDWGVLTPPPPTSSPPLRSLPCDDVMAFYLLQGYPLILSPLVWPAISPPSLLRPERSRLFSSAGPSLSSYVPLMAPRGFEFSLIVAHRDRTSTKVCLLLQHWSATHQSTALLLCESSHLPLLNLLPSAGLSCFAHAVCEIIINPLVMALRSRNSAQGRFFFLFSAAHVLGSASWLNHPEWEIYFISNKTHWLQRHWAKSHPFSAVKVD